jgi:transposase
MLTELSMVEQRYLAVREVLDTGATITQVATQYGVDRRTLHRWLIRYADGGLEALADRSSRPDSSPSQMAPRIEARLVMMRRQHTGWRPRTLRTKLVNEFGAAAPSRSAIYRALVRHQLIVPAPRRRRVQDYKSWERTRLMVRCCSVSVIVPLLLRNQDCHRCLSVLDDVARRRGKTNPGRSVFLASAVAAVRARYPLLPWKKRVIARKVSVPVPTCGAELAS